MQRIVEQLANRSSLDDLTSVHHVHVVCDLRNHTQIGASILGHDKLMGLAREVALHHHERWDGTGYPSGRPAQEFSLTTRIVSVVDVFDALVSRRPYKDPWTTEKAADEIRHGAGTQFDPTVVDAFLSLLKRGELDPHIESAQREMQGYHH